MPGERIMKVAEELYQAGFISYPRTETDSFPPGMDLMVSQPYSSIACSEPQCCSDSHPNSARSKPSQNRKSTTYLTQLKVWP